MEHPTAKQKYQTFIIEQINGKDENSDHEEYHYRGGEEGASHHESPCRAVWNSRMGGR